MSLEPSPLIAAALRADAGPRPPEEGVSAQPSSQAFPFRGQPGVTLPRSFGPEGVAGQMDRGRTTSSRVRGAHEVGRFRDVG